MGLSEISTSLLCLLSNFDDDYGVKGLGDAFPMSKIALGAIFSISFVIIRSIIWPFAAYYCATDVLHALKVDCPHCEGREVWMKSLLLTLIGLSSLQILWLALIFVIGKEEIGKLL